MAQRLRAPDDVAPGDREDERVRAHVPEAVRRQGDDAAHLGSRPAAPGLARCVGRHLSVPRADLSACAAHLDRCAGNGLSVDLELDVQVLAFSR